MVAAAQAVRRGARKQVIAGCRLLRSPMAKDAGLYGGGNSDIPTRTRGRPPQEMSLDGTRTESGEPGVAGDPDTSTRMPAESRAVPASEISHRGPRCATTRQGHPQEVATMILQALEPAVSSVVGPCAAEVDGRPVTQLSGNRLSWPLFRSTDRRTTLVATVADWQANGGREQLQGGRPVVE